MAITTEDRKKAKAALIAAGNPNPSLRKIDEQAALISGERKQQVKFPEGRAVYAGSTPFPSGIGAAPTLTAGGIKLTDGMTAADYARRQAFAELSIRRSE